MSVLDDHDSAPAAATAGAAPIVRATAEVNGVALPDALLVPESWAPGLFVRVNPVEVSWFADLAAHEALAAAALASGAEPRRRTVVDRYFDAPDRRLFRRRVSVRLRHYVDPPRPIAYEVIAIGWGGQEAGGRRVHGFVQTFWRNRADDIPRLVERYERAGFEQIALIEKTRHAFEVVPTRSVDAAGKTLIAPDREGVAGASRYLRVVDFGLRVDVDELPSLRFPERVIVEVEYDPTRRAQAAPIVQRLRDALGARLRPKECNKIACVLGGSTHTVAAP